MLELSFCFVLIYNILLWNIAAQINVTWCDHRGSYQNRILGYGGKSLRSRHFGARTWLGEIRKNVGATRLLKRNLKKNPSTICVRISLFLQVWHTAPSPRPHAEPPHQGLYLWYGCFHQCTASWPLNYIYIPDKDIAILLDMMPPVVRAFCWSSGIPLSLVSLGCA